MNFELKNHILYEFLVGRDNPTKLLYEVRGSINEISFIINKIEKECIKQIENTINNKKTISKNYQIDFTNDGLFFKKMNLSLYTFFSNENTYNGYSDSDSVRKEKNNIICIPQIGISILCNNLKNMIYRFRFAIGHELTHVYNMYQYVKKTGNDLYDNIANKQNYKYISALKDGLTVNKYINHKAIGTVLYRLNRMERNAYIAQLKQEISSMKDKIKDSKSAYNTLISTESYKKNYLYLEKMISLIVNLTDENGKNELISILNKFSKRKFNNYNQVKKYFINRWNKWKKEYMIKASKILYDVFNENGPIYFSNNGKENNKKLTL